MRTVAERCIALAGVFQAAALVAETARRGNASEAAVKASVFSLFQVDADSVSAVFDGIDGVELGLRTLIRQLERPAERNIEVIRYVVSVVQLERKLARDESRLQIIARGIQDAQSALDHFGPLHSNTLARLAQIYSDNISVMSPRIMVKGEPLHLRNPETAARIRCLLLAGLRAALLWRQCGGGRIDLLLRRRRYLHAARDLLAQIVHPITTE